MKISHWNLLLAIYQYQKIGVNPSINRCHKSLIKTCIKNQWVKVIDEKVEVTEKGIIDAAKFFQPLYEKNMTQIGQTY